MPLILKPFREVAVELLDQQVFMETYVGFLIKGGLPAGSQTAQTAQALLNTVSQRSQLGQAVFKAIFVMSKPAEIIVFNSDLGQAIFRKISPVSINP